MPMIRIQLSSALPPEKRLELAAQLSRDVARSLGKPESYMMVSLQPEVPILLGGSNDPAAFIEVRSVGTINPEQARSLSATISAILSKGTNIRADRTYIHFMGVPGDMWGFDGDTFG